MNYLNREVSCTISTVLVEPGINLVVRLDPDDSKRTPEQATREVLQIALINIQPLLAHVNSAPCPPGDEPLLHLELKYWHLPEDDGMDSTHISVEGTRSVDSSGAADALNKLAYRVERKFLAQLARLLEVQ